MDVDTPDRDHLARVGLVAYGVVHLLLGWLTVQLALGDREGEASTSGAIQQLAEQPFGRFLVGAVAVGMFLLALWQAAEAAFDHRGEKTGDEVRHRVVAAAKAVLYAALGTTAARTALGGSGGSGGSGGGSQEQQADTLTARLMQLPLGQVVVGLLGLAILAVGVYLVRKGVTDRFLKDLAHSGAGAAGTAYTWFGRVGYAAKGVAVGAVGMLFGYAALTHDPDESGGVDSALLTVLQAPGGPVLLGLIGLGIAGFGLFCFAWARHVD